MREFEDLKERNWMFPLTLKSLILFLFGFILNVVGRTISGSFTIPFWLDTVGTYFVAALIGPWAGAIEGFFSSIFLGSFDFTSVLYSLVNAVVGMVAGFSFPRGERLSPFRVFASGVTSGVAAVVVSVPLNVYIYDGYTGNVWGDALIDMTSTRMGIPILPYILGEGLIDFPDKVLDVIIVMMIFGIYQSVTKREFKEFTALIFALVVGALLALSPATSVSAAETYTVDNFISRTYSSKEGLDSAELTSVAQTTDGYLWVGGYSGMYRYNGIKFLKEPTEYNVTNVSYLYGDSQGYLWIGTSDIGVVKYDTMDATSIQYNSAKGLSSDSVRCIVEGNNHNVYIGTSAYLSVIRPSGMVGTFDNYDKLSNIVSMDIHENGDDSTLLCVTQTGNLVVLNNEVYKYSMSCKEEGVYYTDIDWAKDNEFYVGTSSNYIEHYRFEESKCVLLETIYTDDLVDINSIHYTEELNSLLLTAENGMGFYNSTRGFLNMNQTEFNSGINYCFQDDQMNFWFASDRQGLIEFSLSDLEKVLYGPNGRIGQATCVSKYNNELYIGTENGIVVKRTEDGKVGDNINYEYLNYFDDMNIRHINIDSGGNLWVCSNDVGGMAQVSRNGEFTFYRSEDSEGMTNRYVMSIELSDGNIAAATINGVYIYKDGQEVEVFDSKDGMDIPQINCLLETEDKKLLCCSDGDGVYVFKDGEMIEHIDSREGLTSQVVLRAVRCGYGYIYVTSNALFYDDRDKVHKLTNFPYSNNYDCYLTETGNLWTSSPAGLFAVNAETAINDALNNTGGYDYIMYDESNGLDSDLTKNGWNCYDEEDCILYYCTNNGVRLLTKEAFNKETPEYETFVDDVLLEGESVVYNDYAYYIPAGEGKITIIPGIINYQTTNPLVRYYIEGMEEETTVEGRQRSLEDLNLSSLKFGDYDVHVQLLDERTRDVKTDYVYTLHKDAMLYEKPYYRAYTMSVGFLFIFFLAWMFSNFRNLSTIEAQYEEIKAAKEEADRANNAKSKFLASMSHEIRTPINAVLGMDEMILRETRDTQILEYANDIYGAGQHLLSIINQILDSSKIESGKMEITPMDYDLGDLIHNTFNLLIQRASEADLSLVVDVNKALPRGLFGDEMRIKQVMVNLLTNAIKYTKAGSIWLRIDGEVSGDNLRLHVEVEDTGVGIKEEDLPGLFDVYKRLELKENYHVEGTGLGLSIASQFLGLMGSELKVESEYGKGSKFYFDIDQQIIDVTPLGEEFQPSEAEVFAEHHSGGSFIAPAAKILVVDDNKMNRQVVRSLLKATQIQIQEASGGEESVEMAKKHVYNVILMDHMMPGMDGVEAMKQIRSIQDGPNSNTPIYVLTANAVAGAKEMYIEEGFDGFISKPIVYAELEAAISATIPDEMKAPMPDDVADCYMEQGGTAPDDLPQIDGLDWNFAWLHLPSRDLLAESLREFYTLIPVQSKKLTQFYDELTLEQSDENYNDYRILVHAMKGLAATIGLIPLAGPAKLLEFAARDKKIDVIYALHPVFIYEWDSYRDKIKGAFDIGLEEDIEKKPGDIALCYKFAQIILKSLHDMDIDTADKAVKKLKEYTYSEEADIFISNIEAAVTNIDEVSAKEEFQKMLDILKTEGGDK